MRENARNRPRDKNSFCEESPGSHAPAASPDCERGRERERERESRIARARPRDDPLGSSPSGVMCGRKEGRERERERDRERQRERESERERGGKRETESAPQEPSREVHGETPNPDAPVRVHPDTQPITHGCTEVLLLCFLFWKVDFHRQPNIRNQEPLSAKGAAVTSEVPTRPYQPDLIFSMTILCCKGRFLRTEFFLDRGCSRFLVFSWLGTRGKQVHEGTGEHPA